MKARDRESYETRGAREKPEDALRCQGALAEGAEPEGFPHRNDGADGPSKNPHSTEVPMQDLLVATQVRQQAESEPPERSRAGARRRTNSRGL